MSLENRAIDVAKATAKCNGLDEQTQNLLHTAYIHGAQAESVLHENEEGNFGQAIETLKLGYCVARKGWNGKGMFLWLKPCTYIQSSWCKDEKLKAIVDANGGEMLAYGTICMKTADNAIVTGWTASQVDMLSNDWILVEP